ncbi:PHP domain-containing protein, partial [Muriicola sp.]|uniref:PHP domain-containing protein n=1 Tax=Muriicola sp. TaxID=2020856 RepID=UPI00356A9941
MYLNCHTYYSLRYGTFSEVALLELARENEVARLALTDINNTSACLNFVRRAADFGIQPILGIDFRNGVDPCFVGIAKNNEGYRELNDFLSHHLHREKKIPSKAPVFHHAFVIYPFEKVLLNDQYHFSDQE